jgi:hypothetical protein
VPRPRTPPGTCVHPPRMLLGDVQFDASIQKVALQ